MKDFKETLYNATTPSVTIAGIFDGLVHDRHYAGRGYWNRKENLYSIDLGGEITPKKQRDRGQPGLKSECSDDTRHLWVSSKYADWEENSLTRYFECYSILLLTYVLLSSLRPFDRPYSQDRYRRYTYIPQNHLCFPLY